MLVCGSDGSDGSDGSIGGVISPSWWRDWGRHSLNTAQSSVAQWPAHTSLITTPGQAETLQETPGSEREREQ